jgi:hypothetical protein
MSELRENACAVGTVGGHLALVLVGEPSQRGRQVEGGLGQGNLQQEAHGTQTQGQHRQRRPRRCERADLTVHLPLPVRRGPPLSPVSHPSLTRLSPGGGAGVVARAMSR